MAKENTVRSPINPHVGLVCRECGCHHFVTVYTRPRNDGIVRRKRCRNCGQAITTREKIT
jgi:hypothetical protein